MNCLLKRQAGLTLVELMVATTLSLVLLSGVLLVFSANKATYQMQTGMGTLQESGRYAMAQITNDLKLAGFVGCRASRLDPNIVMMAASPPGYIDEYASGRFFGGINDLAGSTTKTFGSIEMATGTDSLEIRGPLRSQINRVVGEAAGSSVVRVAGESSGFAKDEYLMIADCTGGALFRATDVSTSGGNTEIKHDATKNSPAGFRQSYGLDSLVTELAVHTYFVGNTKRSNALKRDVTALYRFDGTKVEELVEGIEDLQVEYALDANGDGSVDAFVDHGGVTDWTTVMSVKVSLLVNSVEPASTEEAPYIFSPDGADPVSPPSGDLRLRQEFSTIVSVRNAVL